MWFFNIRKKPVKVPTVTKHPNVAIISIIRTALKNMLAKIDTETFTTGLCINESKIKYMDVNQKNMNNNYFTTFSHANVLPTLKLKLTKY